MIGVLDLQGGVIEHLDHLERLGIENRRVKEPGDLHGLAGLILPGGESTCISRLMRLFGLMDAVVEAFHKGMKIWGTCAGAILLAKTIIGEPPHLGLIDIEVERNGFGSQLDSFTSNVLIPAVSAHSVPLTLIRAPKIRRAGSDVKIILMLDDYIAAVESKQILVTVFHPELTGSLAFHRYFGQKCGLQPKVEVVRTDPGWDFRQWTPWRAAPSRAVFDSP